MNTYRINRFANQSTSVTITVVDGVSKTEFELTYNRRTVYWPTKEAEAYVATRTRLQAAADRLAEVEEELEAIYQVWEPGEVEGLRDTERRWEVARQELADATAALKY